jgi:DNA primase small subunit
LDSSKLFCNSRHLLWIFSGRRGVHCWVCDAEARALTDDQRAAIVESFTYIKGAKGQAIVDVRPHPSVDRAFDILEPLFKKLLVACFL